MVRREVKTVSPGVASQHTCQCDGHGGGEQGKHARHGGPSGGAIVSGAIGRGRLSRCIIVVAVASREEEGERLSFRAVLALPTPVERVHNGCEPARLAIDTVKDSMPRHVGERQGRRVDVELCQPVRHAGHECSRGRLAEGARL